MKTGDGFRVSVIIPVYNGIRYLPETLASVRRQTRPVDEIILVDDGSTDNTGVWIDSLNDEKIVACHQKNSGQAAARNLGIEKSRGDLVALLDSDDLWEPEKIELQIARFNENPALGIVTSRFVEFYSPDIAAATRASTRLKEGILSGPNCSNLLVRKEVFTKVARFDSAWRTGELLEWWSRVAEAGVVADEVAKVLVRRRVHDSNLGRRAARDRGDYFAIIRKQLQRRRRNLSGKP